MTKQPAPEEFWFLTDGKLNIPHALGKVRVGDLHIDREVQRSRTNPKKVQERVEAWDDALAGVIKVSRRPDGKLCVVDGFHRTAAAIKVYGEDAELHAQIFDIVASPKWNGDLGLKDIHAAESAIFVSTDATSRIHPADKFRIRLNGSDSQAVAINDILSEFQLSIGQSGDTRNVIRAAGAVEAAYEAYGATPLTRGLSTLLEVYGHSRVALQGPNIEGLARFYFQYPEVDGRQVVKGIKKFHPNVQGEDLASSARRQMRTSGTRQTRAVAVAKLVRSDHDGSLAKNSKKRLSRDLLDDE